MSKPRSCLFALALATLVIAAPLASAAPTEPVRFAQAAETPKPAAKPPVTTRVKVWTRAKWEAAKRRWGRDHVRWMQCQADLKGQKLKWRAARRYLETCMTKD